MSNTKNELYNNISKFLNLTAELHFFNVLNKTEVKSLSVLLIVLRRMECLSKENKIEEENLEQYIFLLRDYGDFYFYNSSNHNFKSLTKNSEDLFKHLIEYLEGYNIEIKNLAIELDLLRILKKLSKKNDCLARVIKAVSEIDLREEVCSKNEVDEILVYIYNRLSSQDEKDIPKDVVDLTVRLTFTEKNNFVLKKTRLYIGDYALGIGSLIIGLIKHIEKTKESKWEIRPIGTEKNSYKFIIASLRMILLGLNISHIENLNGLINPFKSSRRISYSTMLAPQEYRTTLNNYNEILKEEKNGNKEINRFIGGLPKGNNGFYLYLQHLYYMLIESKDFIGKASIISTISPLLAKRGNCNKSVVGIRKWILKEDFIETIIALPDGLFYNTSIGYYVWIINKNKISTKTNSRKGYIQFIDARQMGNILQRRSNYKHKILSESNINELLELYQNNRNESISKLVSIKNIKPEEDWTLFFNEFI